MKENNNTITTLVTNNLIAECVHSRELENTRFAVYENGDLTYRDHVEHNNNVYVPISAKSHLLTKNVLMLASEATDYGSEEELLSRIWNFIHKYLHISPRFAKIAPYYILLTWVYDKFNELPYLRAIGDYGTGKSRFLQTIGSICYKPIFTAGATTTAPIFRLLDEIRGTLVLDEADFRFSDMSSDIIKILNSGYSKGFPVIRCEGKGVYETRTFDVYSPKVVATRETYKDQALESRFVVEHMGRAKVREDIPRNLGDEFYEEACQIRNRLLMWRLKNHGKSWKLDHSQLSGLRPRLQQITAPMLCLIESPEMRQELIGHMFEYDKDLSQDRAMTRESQILEAIALLYIEEKLSVQTVGQIAFKLNDLLDIHDERISSKKVGWYLRQKLHLKTEKRRGGFSLSLFEQKSKLVMLFDRYGIDNPLREEGELGE